MATKPQSEQISIIDSKGNKHLFVLSCNGRKRWANTLTGELIGTWNTQSKTVSGIRAYYEAICQEPLEAKVVRMF